MGYAVNRQLATDDLPRSQSDANHAHMRVGVLTLPVCRWLSPVLRTPIGSTARTSVRIHGSLYDVVGIDVMMMHGDETWLSLV